MEYSQSVSLRILGLAFAVTCETANVKGSVKQSVLDDIAIFKASPLVRQGLKDATRGFVYDIGTGLLEEVVP